MAEQTATERAQEFANQVQWGAPQQDGLSKQVYYAWIDGYHFGSNESMKKFSDYVAMQPAHPIKVEAHEISLQSYKMYIRAKIKRDSKGNWFIKLKMWWTFWCAK